MELNRKINGFILSDAEKEKIKYISDTIEWVSKCKWDYFLTLTFRHPVKDYVKVTSCVKKFIDRLSGKAYGRSKKRVVAFPVMEKHSDNKSCHIHVLIQDPTVRILNEKRRNRFNFRDAVIESWMASSISAGNPEISSRDGDWMKEVYDVEGVVKYMMKQFSVNSVQASSPIIIEEVCLDGRRAKLD